MMPERWAEVERLLHAALAREGEARAAYLTEACGDDAALRAEVESLLAQDASADGFLREPALHGAARALAMGEEPELPATLTPGQRLGPYEVLAKLGQGGMGQVYKARDTRLGRTVAIKTLLPGVAEDADRRRRFEQEARAVSALDHPHICTLYDIGETTVASPLPGTGGRAAASTSVGAGLQPCSMSVPYLVMEYLEGQTLAERLAKGRLRLEQALEYAAQIADALSVAHRHGVVHRDLKPANVMVTKAGVKLLDFGLARLQGAQEHTGVTATASAVGTVVGTVPYMAPEQVQGVKTDARTDLFAFGAVLYEMLAGVRAFTGDTPASVAAAVLEREPAPLSSRQPLTPPALERLVAKCLAKDPDARWQTAADLRDELTWLSSQAQSDAGVGAAVGRGRLATGRRLLVTVAIAAAAILASASLLARYLAPASPMVKLQVVFAANGLSLTDGGIALSPDGQTIVATARAGTVIKLYARRLDEWTVRPLTGTEDAFAPFFSPDGEWVGFADPDGGLQKVPLRDGPPQRIWAPDHPSGTRITGASWGHAGIVLGQWMGGALTIVAPEGGAARRLTSAASGVWHLWPEWLPGGKAVLYTVWRRGKMSIEALTLASGEVRPVVQAGARPRYLPSGHLVYESEGRLLAVSFDPERLAATGPTVAVVADVTRQTWQGSWRRFGAGDVYSVSSSGTLAYTPPSRILPTLAWKDRHGNTTPLPVVPAHFSMPTLSPDGRTFADTIVDGPRRSIWTGSVGGGPLTRLTWDDDDVYTLFSPDGRWLLFTSNRDGQYNIYRIPTDRSGPAERLTNSPGPQKATSISPDGRLLLINDNTDGAGTDIVLMENGQLRPYVKTTFRERGGSFSPDGRWVAYESNESGVPEIYVHAYPSGAISQVSSGRGYGSPVWSPRGDEIYYQGTEGVMAVPIAGGRRVGLPTLLFEHRSEFRDWDLSPDGQRFLIVEGAEAAYSPPQINVVVNWLQELKARVPAR